MATKVEKQTAIECYVKAQTEMGKALKNASNPHFRSQYADLGNVLEACMKSYTTKVYLVLDKQTMQGLGSAITYARRYGALQMAGIAPEDDDANEASTQPRKNLPIPPKKEEEF